MLDLLNSLCNLNGASGNEMSVREYICSKIEGKVEYKIDNLGNVIAFKKGKKTPKKKLMIAAHMDEVALIVTSVKSDGTLCFSAVGGIDPSVVIGRGVLVGEKMLDGVVGSKAVHNLTADEKKAPPKMDNLYIDIGALDREDALKYVNLGDIAYFNSTFSTMGNGYIRGKALDDRVGCALMLELISSELEFDTYFAFTVQEEIGLRGAKVSAFTVAPDFAIVLETTTAADIYGLEGANRVCELGKGAVVSYMDRSTMYDKELFNIAFELAGNNSIKCQTKTMVAGGNDSGAIHISGSGVRTIAISAPCRYLHSPNCIIKESDIGDCYALTKLLMERISSGC